MSVLTRSYAAVSPDIVNTTGVCMKFYRWVLPILAGFLASVAVSQAQSPIRQPNHAAPGGVLLPNLGMAQPEGARAPATGADLARLVRQDGQVNVIVSLALDATFHEEGRLSNAEVQRQRGRIGVARNRVLAELPLGSFTLNREYESIPAVALQVDESGLAVLERSSSVTQVVEDALSVTSLLQSVPLIGAPRAWSAGYDGSGWAVAILDTGIDINHSFFRNAANNSRIVAEACYSRAGGAPAGTASLCPNGTPTQTGAGAANANTANCLSGGNQLCDHGTHVAGIAAGYNGSVLGETLNGVAPNANIIAIQVFTRFTTAAGCNPNPAPCVKSYNSDQLAALNYINTTLRPSHNIASVNMSLGGGSYASYCDATAGATKTAIDNLRSNGIATIIATGNDGSSSTISSPACISTAIAVSSTSKVDIVSGFSNVATIMDLFAPGSGGAGGAPWDGGIASSVPGGWALMSGTSMATPHVAGAWAVAKQAAPAASVTDVLNAFITTGTPVTDTRPSASGTITKPRINVDGAVAVLTGGTTWTVTPSVNGSGGSIAPASAVTVANGATPSFNLFPDPGFVVDTVGGTCGGTLSGGRYTTNAVSANCTVTASFKPFVGNPEVCGTLNYPLVQTADGSAFSFLTGIAQGYSASRVDDINLYVNGGNMWAWWYGGPGGVASGAQVAVLAAGTTIGPGSTFNNDNKAMNNWLPGRTGYLGIAFENANTGVRNYGWLRMTTAGTNGYPATWHEYCYNSVGGSIVAGTPPAQHTITVNRSPVAGGTASCSPNPVYNGLASVCGATPNPGYTFSGWSGACSGATCVLTNVTSVKTVTANFTASSYTLTFDAQGGIPTPASMTGSAGVTVTLPAAPTRTGYTFVNWNTAANGSGTAHAAGGSYAMPASNTTLYAIWTVSQYTLAYQAGPHGSIVGNASQTVAHGGSGTAVTAVADAGWFFDVWSDGRIDNPRTDINVEASIAVTARFSQRCDIFCNGFEDNLAPRSEPLVLPGDETEGVSAGWRIPAVGVGVANPVIELLDARGTAIAWIDAARVADGISLRLRRIDAQGAEQAGTWVSWAGIERVGYVWGISGNDLLLRFGADDRYPDALVLILPEGARLPEAARVRQSPSD